MWTEQTRGRMAKIAKKTKRYPSDLTDEEWERIAPLMPRALARGRRRTVEFREGINAVRYLVRSGCGWGGVPAPGAKVFVSDHPRPGIDARSREGGPGGQPLGRRARQPDGRRPRPMRR